MGPPEVHRPLSTSTRLVRTAGALGLLASLASAPGCDTSRVAAQVSGDLVVRASDELQRHWDEELIGDAMPGTIVQLEGVFAVVPDDETVGLVLIRAYSAYAFGWVEDEADLAEMEGDLDEADRVRARARHLYERARNVALHLLRRHGEGLDAAIAAGPEALATWLSAHVHSEREAMLALWAGLSWGSAIGVSGGDPELVADLTTARTFAERAVAVDETLDHAAGLTFLAGISSATGEGIGGDPERGRQIFERALLATERRSFVVQLAYASTYAITMHDRTLFVTLLREIIDGGDPDPDARIGNRVARRRAIHLLQRVDELF
ncbi:MAG: TRAP transporter TatT component family protein [Sandaracinus sp.]